jgi:hypothetical protein
MIIALFIQSTLWPRNFSARSNPNKLNRAIKLAIVLIGNVAAWLKLI